MSDKASNIFSSQARELPVNHTVVDGFAPQNGHDKNLKRDPAGKSTNRITKSESDEQAGPKTNNL